MTIAAVVVLCLVAGWLTFFPMVDSTKRDLDPWPWIVGGLVAGPLSGVVYLSKRRAERMVAQRNGDAG